MIMGIGRDAHAVQIGCSSSPAMTNNGSTRERMMPLEFLLMRKNFNRIEVSRISENPMPATKVSVTRRGQTTIPAEFRRKYGIDEGSMLEIEDTGRGLLLTKARSTTDLIGTGSRSQREIFDALDKMREEDDR